MKQFICNLKNRALLLSLSVVIVNNMYAQCPKSSDLENLFLKSIKEKNIDMVKQCIDAGVNYNGAYCTDFQHLLQMNHVSKYVKYQSSSMKTPYIATVVATGDTSLIKLFIEKGVNLNTNYQRPIFENDPEPNRPSVNNRWLRGWESTSPLLAYLTGGKLTAEAMELLHGSGARLTPQDISYIEKLSAHGMCKFLSGYGYSFTFNEENLRNAINNKDKEGVDFYLSQGVKPNTYCLLAACEKNNIDLVKQFLDMGLSIEARDSEMKYYRFDLTVLGWAIKAGDFDFVKYLVEKGADLNTQCIFTRDKKLFKMNYVDFAQHRAEVKVSQKIVDYLVLERAKRNM